MPRGADLTGLVFGLLTVDKRHAAFRRNPNVPPETYYACTCQCGTKKMVRGASLTFGCTKSCGCQRGRGPQPSKRLRYGESNFNIVFRRYSSEAKRRQFPFKITQAHAKRLMGGFCFYCGSPPMSVADKPGSYGAFVYNGIDRIDSTKGYVRGNVVTCCASCNWIKGRCDFGRFVAWVQRAAKHIDETSSSWPKPLKQSVRRAEANPLMVGMHPKSAT